MSRRCPPGVICIENMSFIFLLITISLAIMIYFQFRTQNATVPPPNKIIIEAPSPSPQRRSHDEPPTIPATFPKCQYPIRGSTPMTPTYPYNGCAPLHAPCVG